MNPSTVLYNGSALLLCLFCLPLVVPLFAIVFVFVSVSCAWARVVSWVDWSEREMIADWLVPCGRQLSLLVRSLGEGGDSHQGKRGAGRRPVARQVRSRFAQVPVQRSRKGESSSPLNASRPCSCTSNRNKIALRPICSGLVCSSSVKSTDRPRPPSRMPCAGEDYPSIVPAR